MYSPKSFFIPVVSSLSILGSLYSITKSEYRALKVIEYFVAQGSLLIEINRSENRTGDGTMLNLYRYRHLDNVCEKKITTHGIHTADINLKLTKESRDVFDAVDLLLKRVTIIFSFEFFFYRIVTLSITLAKRF